jgi:hypothetical protein
MKTIKKAMLGIIFLMPLFLPSETKAGGFNDPFRTEHPGRLPDFDNRLSNQRDYRGESGYRPYDPWADRHPAPPARSGWGDPSSPGGGNAVPIDGGLIFLLVAGFGLGAIKLIELRRRPVTVALSDQRNGL